MIYSMTAFARRDLKTRWGNASWELRSVNQRYFEIYVFLPEQFRGLEPIIRNFLCSKLTRGKVECRLRFESTLYQKNEFLLNEDLANQLIRAANWIKKIACEGEINPLEILRWPGVMLFQEHDLDVVSKNLLKELECVLDDFIINREREGKMLKIMIEKRLDAMNKEVQDIRHQMPYILRWKYQSLQEKLAEIEIQIDNHRLQQELVMMSQRFDIAEELDRLEAHIKEIHNILGRREPVGRRLDFMMQECNREANTLSAKAINSQVSNSAVELKVLIEQIREQIQNIE